MFCLAKLCQLDLCYGWPHTHSILGENNSFQAGVTILKGSLPYIGAWFLTRLLEYIWLFFSSQSKRPILPGQDSSPLEMIASEPDPMHLFRNEHSWWSDTDPETLKLNWNQRRLEIEPSFFHQLAHAGLWHTQQMRFPQNRITIHTLLLVFFLLLS